MTSFEAVVLAAGRGSRLGPAGTTTPKALLPLGDGDSFLRRLCAQLSEAGAERVRVVVGHLAEQFEAVTTWGLPIELVRNPDDASGSLRSLQCAMQAGALGGGLATIVTDADIVVESLIVAATATAAGTAVAVSPGHAGDDEAVLVWGAAQAPRFLGKGLTPDLVGGLDCLGEAVGMFVVAAPDQSLARDVTDWLLRYGPAKAMTEHEELSGRLMQLGRMRAVVTPGAFLECDTEADYFRAQQLHAELTGR